MSRELFTAGCVVLVLLGLVHLLGHYSLVTSRGDDAAERQLLEAMRSNPQDMGLGFRRTMFDIVSDFSLYLSLSSFGLGLLGFVVRRHASAAPGLLQQAAIAYAGTYAVIAGMGLRYWFPAPLLFLVAAFLCFAVAAAVAPRGA